MHTFQPPWQQVGVISRHGHHFCNMKKPTPIFDQSVHTAVHLLTSKSLIPSSTLLAMCSLDCSNRVCSAVSQYHLVVFFNRSLNGWRAPETE